MRPTASCLVLRCAFVFVTCHFGSSAKTNKHQERKVEGSACLAIEQAEFTRAEDVSVAKPPWREEQQATFLQTCELHASACRSVHSSTVPTELRIQFDACSQDIESFGKRSARRQV